jgi:parvulin-like peptidyl-prolyl isomerase
MGMKKITILFLSAVCAFAQALPSAAPAAAPSNAPKIPGDQVVADVGGFTITKDQFELLLGSVPEQSRTPATKQTVLTNVLSMLQMAQDARGAQFDKRPDQALQMRLVVEQELASSYLAEQMKKLGDDAFMKDWYAKNSSQFSQWKARHILVRTQGSVVPVRKGMKELSDAEALAKAKAIRVKLVGGADFATVAKADSDDTGSSANGGDMGFFGPGEMVQPVEEAVSKMKPNEISEPVKTDFGYHIVQLQEVRTKPFEDAKEEIRQKSQGDLQRQVVEMIRKKHPATINNDYFAQ